MNVLISFILIVLSTAACIPVVQKSEVKNSRADESGAVVNSVNTVEEGYGRALQDNPIILTGNRNLNADIRLSSLLRTEQDFITLNQFLLESCQVFDSSGIPIASISECFAIRNDPNANFTPAVKNRWGFNPETEKSKFIETHTFFHIKKIINRYLDDLKMTYDMGQGLGVYNFKTALKGDTFTAKRFWRKDETFTAFPGCDFINNARYEPANWSVCLGFDSEFRFLKFAEDPTIIYHEFGHALVNTMMNLRNDRHLGGADLGALFYDEALSINEGLTDWFSYYINGRPHVFEWALERFSGAGRPVTEDDYLHAPGISSDPSQRLSYPDFINYDPNFPETPVEDVHYSGMIGSHFLVTLGNDLQSFCLANISNSNQKLKTSQSMIMATLLQTMAYLGDFSATGYDNSAGYRVNLNPENSFEWFYKINPVSYRSFFQTFARFFLEMYSNPLNPACSNSTTSYSYPRDRLEAMLDSYGLLLFNSYNEDGNGLTGNDPSSTNTKVYFSNRKKSITVNKDLLIPSSGTEAFIFDVRADLVGVVNSLLRGGVINSISEQIASDLPFNNGNGKISPGEVVGISLNLVNNSNTAMGGVQILSNDWDHTRDGRPCNSFEDSWPLTSEGGINDQQELNAGQSLDAIKATPGTCAHITKVNGAVEDGQSFVTDPIMPICFMQIREEKSTRWVNQEVFRQDIALEKNLCLGGDQDTKDCFIRAIKGADNSYFSRLGPKQTWTETLTDPETNLFTFQSNNILLFEVSPWIPPGTSIHCRFRARFTNCSNCWEDENGEDYRDFEYSGATPFKIIPFEFIVID
ncbi:MAG: hypothetical protein ACO20H_12540 [Bacteriovoracaceae bacterium]